MLKRLVIFLAILAGLAALADRGLAAAAGNATANQIRVHEGLREDPDVTFKGFPFVTQAFRGEFREVDVTVRDYEKEGLTIERIDAVLEGVEVDLGDAVNGRVSAVPISAGVATLTVTYGDLTAYLATKPGNIRVQSRDGRTVVVSSFGIPGVGQVDVEGTPTVKTGARSIRVTVSNVRPVAGDVTLTSALAATAAARSSFTIPLDDLPFGIKLKSAVLTGTALEVTASAEGFTIDARSNLG
ncbi:MAG TPA: DUF2993 domain-containing protein [Frankiaceae bacterium]|nr:DUF2993 domain-containing protein [Frankiaceae bacterium]